MPYHLAAGASSIALSAADANIGLLTDVFLTNTNDGYLPPRDLRVLAAYARIPNGTAARINSPLLRIPSQPRLSRVDLAADPPNLPPINTYMDNGPILRTNDPFNVQASRGAVAAAVSQYLLWLSPDMPTVVKGDVRTVKATAAITGSTTAWVAGAFTFEQGLPYGKYQIVGLAALGLNLLAVRFVLPDSQMRPGTIAQQTFGEYGWDWTRFGNLGVWATFNSTAQPIIEILCYGACTAQELEIDIIKVG